MLTVDDYGAIRRARRDGKSIREIARTFHHTRRKIRQVLTESEPCPYTRTNDRPAPVLGPFHPVINQLLSDDEAAPPKQRHTAARVYRRLRDEHNYAGGYGFFDFDSDFEGFLGHHNHTSENGADIMRALSSCYSNLSVSMSCH